MYRTASYCENQSELWGLNQTSFFINSLLPNRVQKTAEEEAQGRKDVRWKAGGSTVKCVMTWLLHELMNLQQSGLPEQVLHNIKSTPILNKWSLWLIAYTKEVLWVYSWWQKGISLEVGVTCKFLILQEISWHPHSLVTVVVLMPMTTQERRKEVARGDCWWRSCGGSRRRELGVDMIIFHCLHVWNSQEQRRVTK